MRALTSLCSDIATSPQNARELSMLINQLFVFTNNEPQSQPHNYDKIHQAISKGKSIQSIKIAEDIREIKSSFIAVNRIYKQLRSELENIFTELTTASIPLKKILDADFDSFCEQLIKNESTNSITLYELMCGEQENNTSNFKFRIHCFVYKPSLQSFINSPSLPESSNIFTFALQRYANLTRVTFPHITKRLTFERTGELTIRNEAMAEEEVVTINSIGQMMKTWISDHEAWEIIQRDR